MKPCKVRSIPGPARPARPSAAGGVTLRGRSVPRPPPPSQPPAPAAFRATGPPAGRPGRPSTTHARIPTPQPFGSVDAAQQRQQGRQLCQLTAAMGAALQMTVELGTLGAREAAHQVGAQRNADIVPSVHHVTAVRSTPDRVTCPLTVSTALRFSADRGMWPRPSIRNTTPPARQSGQGAGERHRPLGHPRIAGKIGRTGTISTLVNALYDAGKAVTNSSDGPDVHALRVSPSRCRRRSTSAGTEDHGFRTLAAAR